MLEQAFYEPAVVRELETARGHRIVVGRRGAGKSAVFQHLGTSLHALERKHEDHTFRSTISLLEKDLHASSYAEATMVMRVAWRTRLLIEAAENALDWEVTRSSPEAPALRKHLVEYSIKKHAEGGLFGVLAQLRALVSEHASIHAIDAPEQLVARVDEKRLTHLVNDLLSSIRRDVIFAFDGLDEGWIGTPVATGVIGGLVRACADLSARTQHVRTIVFLRDSMLRSVAHADQDHARDIEGSSIRLDWSWEALFKMLGGRLRVLLRLPHERSNAVLWGRIVDGDLKGQDGFKLCLRRTLLRPRDLIQLINDAARNAAKHERDRILMEDIVASDTKWSNVRLDDLIKEYSDVFPGLRELATLFSRQPDLMDRNSVLHLLAQFFGATTSKTSGLIGLLVDPAGAFSVLSAIGFLGAVHGKSASFNFDGSQRPGQELSSTDHVMVHPCYWGALQIERTDRTVDIELDDTYDIVRTAGAKEQAVDVRVQMIGTRAAELEQIPRGRDHIRDFERWALTTARVVLHDLVAPLDLRPHSKQHERSRIVGTTVVSNGFFQRLRLQHSVEQVVLQCVNSDEVSETDIIDAQNAAHGTKSGDVVFLVRRAPYDEPTHAERALLASMDSPKVVILPAQFFQGAIVRMKRPAGDGRSWFLDKLDRALTRHERYWRGNVRSMRAAR